jgi:inhibitor of KinA sporulation pathway (predicted exonuclease)
MKSEEMQRWLWAQADANQVVMADVEVWAKGDFDLRILKHAAKARGMTVPWMYHQARELRTVLKWAGVNGNSADTVHRALDDARRQVELLEVAEGILAKGL